MKNCELRLRLSGFLTAILLGSIIIGSACVAAGSTTIPTIQKQFLPSTTTPGTPVELQFMIDNPNAGTESGIGFTDNLPAGLTVSTPNDLSGSCFGGTITAVAGSSVIELSGASIPAVQSCTFQLDVVASNVGTYTNAVTIDVGSITGNTAVATLSVVATPEPSSMLLLGTGALGFLGPIRRRRLLHWKR